MQEIGDLTELKPKLEKEIVEKLNKKGSLPPDPIEEDYDTLEVMGPNLSKEITDAKQTTFDPSKGLKPPQENKTSTNMVD